MGENRAEPRLVERRPALQALCNKRLDALVELPALIRVGRVEAAGERRGACLDEGLEAPEEAKRRVERIVGGGVCLGGEAFEEGEMVGAVVLGERAGEIGLVGEMVKEGALGQARRVSRSPSDVPAKPWRSTMGSAAASMRSRVSRRLADGFAPIPTGLLIFEPGYRPVG